MHTGNAESISHGAILTDFVRFVILGNYNFIIFPAHITHLMLHLNLINRFCCTWNKASVTSLHYTVQIFFFAIFAKIMVQFSYLR